MQKVQSLPWLFSARESAREPSGSTLSGPRYLNWGTDSTRVLIDREKCVTKINKEAF